MDFVKIIFQNKVTFMLMNKIISIFIKKISKALPKYEILLKNKGEFSFEDNPRS